MNSPARLDISTFSPSTQEIHHLHQDDPQSFLRMPIGLHHRLHPWNIPMMIRAPHIDQEIKPSP
jgi:hypothetical protein